MNWNFILLIIISLHNIQALLTTFDKCPISVKSCKFCYSEEPSFHLTVCYDKKGKQINQNQCIKNCCQSTHNDTNNDNTELNRSDYTFSIDSFNACIDVDSTNIHTAYFSFIIIICILKFLVIILRIYLICKSCPQQLNRVFPNVSQNSVLNLNNNLPNNNIQQKAAQKKDYPPNSNKIIEEQSNTCCICLEGRINTITKCGHVFHMDCLATWCNRKKSCPMCKYKKANEAKVYCSKCKQMKKIIDLRKTSKMELQTLRSECKSCKI